MTIQELQNHYVNAGLSNYFEEVMKYARNAIHMHISPCDDENVSLGCSKIGGLPDLPMDQPWFFREDRGERTPLSFLCQINFAQIKPYDWEQKLPDHGILYLFYDCDPDCGMPWGFDPEDASGTRVLFYDGDPAFLRRAQPPAALADFGTVFPAATMTYSAQWELPDYFSIYSDLIPLTPEQQRRADDLIDDLAEHREMNNDVPTYFGKLLGHSDNIQGSMEDECEYISQGHSCCSPADLQGVNKGVLDFTRWKLLLQLGSCDDMEMMWGDEGNLYLWITQEDLAARRFDRCWLILQCS